MVLIEPVGEMWPNTKATWEKNDLEPPRATFLGFAGDCDWKPQDSQQGVNFHDWPKGPDYSKIIKAIKFKLLHEHADSTACIKLDTLAIGTGDPDALHIDVEGAGLIVLKGAENILKRRKPIVWIALHPDFMRDRFKTDPKELHEFMKSLGYTGTLLAVDHEHHWIFQ